MNQTGSNGNTGAYISEYRYGYKPVPEYTSVYVLDGQTYRLVSQDYYSYLSARNVRTFSGFHVSQRIFTNNWEFDGRENYRPDEMYPYNYVNSFFFYFDYKIYTGKELLWKKTSTQYASQANVTTTETYSYDSNNRVTKIEQIKSDGNIVDKRMVYPDAQNHRGLYGKNMIAGPVETKVYHNDVETSRQSIKYGLNDILPGSIVTASGGAERTSITFNRYASNGNVLQYTTPDGVSICYIWSYGGEYPVAEIRNAQYSAVTQAMSAEGLSESTVFSSTNPAETVFTKLKNLRSRLPDSQVSVYKYKPLVGVIEQTNPDGRTTYYTYDSFGRLSEAYYYEKVGTASYKRILETYNYNYRNQ